MERMHGIGAALALLVALSVSAQSTGSTADGAPAMPAGAVFKFNIVDWDGGPLPPLYERSAQLPLSLDNTNN